MAASKWSRSQACSVACPVPHLGGPPEYKTVWIPTQACLRSDFLKLLNELTIWPYVFLHRMLCARHLFTCVTYSSCYYLCLPPDNIIAAQMPFLSNPKILPLIRSITHTLLWNVSSVLPFIDDLWFRCSLLGGYLYCHRSSNIFLQQW